MWRLVIAFACGCATSHGQRIMEMSTGCLGWCQAYEVAVYEDGFVEYRGFAHVERVRRTAHLTAARLAELDTVFVRNRFATIDPDAIQCDETDLGVLYTVSYRGQHLSFFDLCPKVSTDALLLVGDVRTTLQLDRWFGRDHDRR